MSEPFTVQDRKDVANVLSEVCARVLDEFQDCESLSGMYGPFQELIVRAALTGDMAFALQPEDEQLLAACRRILGSGRFDYYAEE